MHSYINPVHEKKIAECLYELGFHHVSCSSSLAPFIKIVPRAQTAVVDGYLSLIIDDYPDRRRHPLPTDLRRRIGEFGRRQDSWAHGQVAFP